MRKWIKKIFGFGLASFFGDLSHEMTISLVPILVFHLVGQAQMPFFLGLIAGLSSFFSSFLRIISGLLADKLTHKKPLIVLGYAVTALFSTLVGFAHSIHSIIFYRILSFAGSGLREPPRDALIAETVESAYYGRSFGLKNAMDTLGALIGPLITLAIAKICSLRTIFALSFIPGILAVCSILFFTNDIQTDKKTPRFTPPFWKEFSHLPRSFIFFSLILFLFHIGNFDKLLLLTRAQKILSTPQENILISLVFLYALFNVVRACSEFIIGLISDYTNRIVLLAFLGCGSFAGVAILLLPSHGSLGYCSLVFTLAGISAATLSTLKKVCAADLLPTNIRGLGYGILQASEGIATLVANILIGFLWTHYSPYIGLLFVIFTSMIGLVSLMIFKLFS